MPTFSDTDYEKFLLPKRLVFFDLDGTIIPSTSASGRRIAIAIAVYDQLREFSEKYLQVPELPEIDNEQCSKWYRHYDGPNGLINRVLEEIELAEELKKCLSFYFNGLFNQRLTQYLPEDLAHDTVPQEHFKFLHVLLEFATMILVSYRYQTEFGFLKSLELLKLDELFGPNNAFPVGQPGSSSDGSKSRFVGGKWRREIRAQRRLTSSMGKTFPPIVIGDSIRDIHFAIDIGGIFFGVSETGEASSKILLNEFEKQSNHLHIRSRVFSSLADKQLQGRLLEECQAYKEETDAYPADSTS